MNLSNELLKRNDCMVSIILPTYNESPNILQMLHAIRENLPKDTDAEIIVVDDNSPDGTAELVGEFARKECMKGFAIKLIHRTHRSGLSSAILNGIRSSSGGTIVVMDSDLSHPPQMIPTMIKELQENECDIVIASRYIKGASVINWPFQRKILSKSANGLARHGLGVNVKDPMSGFFAFKYRIIEGIKFDAIGYKMLLELLVKTKGVKVKEIPYTFTNRKNGSSKFNLKVIVDYLLSILKLYRYGSGIQNYEKRASVRFLSKAGRFYTVGASGLMLNYIISYFIISFFPNVWYIHATTIGIFFSITSNFILNKAWTFEDKEFAIQKTIKQYILFSFFSIGGALIQLGILSIAIESYNIDYTISLIMAVGCASVSNFLLNKKWTFKEKIWS